jgi:hypothetical protein
MSVRQFIFVYFVGCLFAALGGLLAFQQMASWTLCAVGIVLISANTLSQLSNRKASMPDVAVAQNSAWR